MCERHFLEMYKGSWAHEGALTGRKNKASKAHAPEALTPNSSSNHTKGPAASCPLPSGSPNRVFKVRLQEHVLGPSGTPALMGT